MFSSQPQASEPESQPEVQPEPEPTAATAVVPSQRMQAGDVVTFGSYRQSQADNEKTPLNWVVIGTGVAQNAQGEALDCAFLLCQSVIDYRVFNEQFAKTSWEKCDLREWLNDEFLWSFTDEEHDQMLLTDISTDGTPTRDHVWLLSEAEYGELRPLLETVLLGCTDRAADWRDSFAGGVDGWWLRDSGKTASRARYVTGAAADVVQAEVDQRRGVRPVITIVQP